MSKKLKYIPDFPKTFEEAEELLGMSLADCQGDTDRIKGMRYGLRIGIIVLQQLKANLTKEKLK